MARLTLEAGDLAAEIDTDLGSGVCDFSIRGPMNDRVPMLRRAPAEPRTPYELGCYLLAPWSNRIAHARFAFDGATHGLRANFPDGSAIHGVCMDRPWRIVDRTPVSVRTAFDARAHERVNWPFEFGAVFRAELAPDALTLELDVTNLGEGPMPAGCGFHPFFMRTLFALHDEVCVRAPVTGRYPSEGCIPTGEAVEDDATRALNAGGPLGDPGLDDCFTGFGGRATIEWPASGVRLTMDCSAALEHLVVFTPRHNSGPGPWFCVEPVSHATNALNEPDGGLARGVRVLSPGQTLHTRVTMTVHTERTGR